jgi:hypothetical protein
MGKKRSRELEGKEPPVEDPTVDKMDEDDDDDDEVGRADTRLSDQNP